MTCQHALARGCHHCPLFCQRLPICWLQKFSNLTLMGRRSSSPWGCLAAHLQSGPPQAPLLGRPSEQSGQESLIARQEIRPLRNEENQQNASVCPVHCMSKCKWFCSSRGTFTYCYLCKCQMQLIQCLYYFFKQRLASKARALRRCRCGQALRFDSKSKYWFKKFTSQCWVQWTFFGKLDLFLGKRCVGILKIRYLDDITTNLTKWRWCNKIHMTDRVHAGMYQLLERALKQSSKCLNNSGPYICLFFIHS